MLSLRNRLDNIGLKYHDIRTSRINIEQPQINNIEYNQTPNKLYLNNNIINNRLLFKKDEYYIIEPVNKKRLTMKKPIESTYNDNMFISNIYHINKKFIP